MDFKPHIRAVGDHFASILVLLATIGYILIKIFADMDFREYLYLVYAMILAYYMVKSGGIFWLSLIVLGLYLIFVHIIPDSYIDRVSAYIRVHTDEFMDNTFGKSIPVAEKPAPEGQKK